MSDDHDSIVIARLRDTAENIHSRGPVIAAQHLRDAADRIAGQRQQIEALEAANASLATDAGLWAKAPGPAITCDPRIRTGNCNRRDCEWAAPAANGAP